MRRNETLKLRRSKLFTHTMQQCKTHSAAMQKKEDHNNELKQKNV